MKINMPSEEEKDSQSILIKDHISHEETFVEVYKYAESRLKDRHSKTFLFGFMAGFFVGLAYILVINAISGFIIREEDGTLSTIVPIGIIALITGLTFIPAMLMIIFIGGFLFTSNSLTSLVIIKKQANIKKMIANLSFVMLGNLSGSLVVAASTYLMGNMVENSHFYNAFEYIYQKKSNIDFDWWTLSKNFVSAIYCNILIAGVFWITSAVKNSAAKILIVFFMIFGFGVSGFQHIVANSYVFFTGIFLKNETIGKDTGLFLVLNMLPTLLGNFLGGGILLPSVYLFLFNKRINSQIRQNNF